MSDYSLPHSQEDVNRRREWLNDLANRIAALVRKRHRSDVEARFEMGDMMNQFRGVNKAEVRSLVVGKVGEGEYKLLRNCAWTALRWSDREKRKTEVSRGRAWSYFRDTDPNTGEKTYDNEKAEVVCEYSDPEMVDGNLYMTSTCRGKSARGIVTPVVAEQIISMLLRKKRS